MEQSTQHPAPTLRFRSSQISDRGVLRPHNEDYSGLIEPASSAASDQGGCLYIAADGVGQTKKGEYTSHYAVKRVLSAYYQNVGISPGQRLGRVIDQVSAEIALLTEENGASTLATTLVAAVIKNNLLTVANVGDSRAYLIHDGSAQQITRDHNQLSELLNMGAVSVEEVENSSVENRLTRSLGGPQDLVVDLFEDIPLYSGDVLLLCTDGLSRYVSDEQLATVTASADPEEACQRLVEYANLCGGEDNVTVLVVMVQGTEPEQVPVILSDFAVKSQPAVEPGDVAVDLSALLADKPHIQRKAKPRREYFLTAAAVGLMILVAVVLAGVLANQRSGELLTETAVPAGTGKEQALASETPRQAVLAAAPFASPTQTLYVPAPTEAVIAPNEAPMLPGNEMQTPTATIRTSEEPGSRVCVRPVNAGEGLFSLIRSFDISYDRAADYYYYADCSAEELTCTGPKERIDNHQAIFPGWYIEITERSQESCELGKGFWVLLIE